MVLLRQKYEAPLSIKSPESRTKGNVDIKGGNYSKSLNKQDVNLTDRLLARKEWASLKYGSAEVKRQTFPVTVYGVQRSGVNKKL